MSQQQAIDEILEVLEKSNPKKYAEFMGMSHGEKIVAVGKYVLGNPQEFKPVPPGSTNFGCFLLADYNFAQGIILCKSVTDPALQVTCLNNNMDAYCDAHGACESS